MVQERDGELGGLVDPRRGKVSGASAAQEDGPSKQTKLAAWLARSGCRFNQRQIDLKRSESGQAPSGYYCAVERERKREPNWVH